MIILNITSLVEWSIDEEWRKWVVEEYVPELMNTGLFTEYRLAGLLESDDKDGQTYVLQLFARTDNDLLCYREKYHDHFEELTRAKWHSQTVSFQTAMRVIR